MSNSGDLKTQEHTHSHCCANTFSSHYAHKALIGAFLFEKDADKPDPPKAVKPGTAFCYRELPAGERTWMIVEDEPKPEIHREEYSKDHHISRNAIGKEVNDTFVLKEK